MKYISKIYKRVRKAQKWDVQWSQKVEDVFWKANDAFWAEVAQAFPQAKTGDFPPDEEFPWQDAAKRAIAAWLSINLPEGEQPLPMLSTKKAAKDCKCKYVKIMPGPPGYQLLKCAQCGKVVKSKVKRRK